jgi:hypothetical protein
MNWLTAPLRKVAPSVTAQCNFVPEDKVWQLSLDQIEGDTGEIIEKNYAPASEAGASTIYFDEGNVLYSKLRPYLNKVALPDEPGIATTELIPLRPDPLMSWLTVAAALAELNEFTNEAPREQRRQLSEIKNFLTNLRCEVSSDPQVSVESPILPGLAAPAICLHEHCQGSMT